MKKLYTVNRKLKNMKEDHYILMVSPQLTQKELEPVRKELKERDLPTENLQKAAKTRKPGEGGKKGGRRN